MTQQVGAPEAAAAALRALEGGPAVCSVLALDPPLAGRRILCWADRSEGSFDDVAIDHAVIALARDALASAEAGMRRLETADSPAFFFDPVFPLDHLLVVGAGHIGVPLAELGAKLGFDVTVLDDRAEFADTTRFAPGLRVLRCDFSADPFAGVRVDAQTYVALVTRGHAWDFDCLRLLLARAVQPRYIGMIGSRRRVRAAFTSLLDAGVPRERLEALHAPIGLDIGAETPVEIAVSIAAELIQVRRGGTARPLTEREQVLDRLLPDQA